MATITICDNCNKEFEKPNHELKKTNIFGKLMRNFCSKKCHRVFQKKYLSRKKLVKCKNCGKEFKKTNAEIKKTKNNFCTQSCSATYNNTHKTTGINRSKLEKWIESKLSELYPNLDINYNERLVLNNAELDIYIPSLRLAFELNGIFHYEPIFGKERLNETQEKDRRKFKLCHEKNISLCVIDTSSQKYFKEQTSEKYLKIITDIIGESSRGR